MTAGRKGTRPSLGTWIKAFLVWLAAHVLMATVRFRVRHVERLERARESGKAVLYAFWHGRQLALFKANPESRLAVMTSLSRDGEMQSLICRWFGLDVVRGSSSRSGLSGLLALTRSLKQGTAVGVAVDGPRGPAFEAKPGITTLARVSGSSVVPITVGFRRRWELGRTWDGFQIPKPFTIATVAYGEPIVVSADASRDAVRQATQRLTASLRTLTAEVDEPSGAGLG